MTDWYKQRLAHAQWTWRENRPSPHGSKCMKDRESGRHEKRRARQKERRDIQQDMP